MLAIACSKLWRFSMKVILRAMARSLSLNVEAELIILDGKPGHEVAHC